MSRIEARFRQLAGQGRKALIPYIAAGDPVLNITVPVMHAMVDAGADVIELGVPFSDPMADGPVIQQACERALAAGISLKGVLGMVTEFRQKDADTPVVLMGYLNPVEAMGYEQFVKACVEAGVDGVLLVDLPPEEAESVRPLFVEHGIDMIFLLAPTTTEARMDSIAAAGSGYLYYVSLKGVTGAGNLDVDEVERRVETIRNHTGLPVGVGFGIKDAESARAISRVSDGVVVGSALVNQMAANVDDPQQIPARIASILADMRQAMDD